MDLNSLVNEYQSIKIVPSIEEIVRQNGFNADIDEDTMMWLNHLKVVWLTWKKSATVQNLLHHFFNSASDTFAVVLAIIIKCEDFKDCKPKTLPYCIIEELNLWRQKYDRTPTADLKLIAFHVATQQRNQDFLNLIVKTYFIKTEKTALLPLVQGMIRQGLYKQALQSVSSLDMYNDVPVQDLLFPLVLQDKSSMVDSYLMQCPNQVEPFVLYIDQLLDRSIKTKDFIQNYIEEHDIIDVKWDKLYNKPLGKLAARLCNKFKIPIKVCHNLSNYRTTGGLRYLINQRYVEKKVSVSAWDDLVKDALEEYPDASENFIDLLIDHDSKEALRWAKILNIPEEKYPSTLKYIEQTEETVQQDENWDLEPGPSKVYLELSLESNQIHIIDTGEKFYEFLSTILQNVTVVGVDCEWKPSFVASQSKIALIQIATQSDVYLIDAIVLNKPEYASCWQMFLRNLLYNAEIIKVGFGLENDLRGMKSSLVGLGTLKGKGEGFLDLALLWKCLTTVGLEFPYENESGGCSLSSLTVACFGLPLMKHEQCSNWEVRPLRKSQIEYAALDAFVLVQIYFCIENLCRHQKLNFDEICQNVMVEGKQKTSKKKPHEMSQLSTQILSLESPKSVEQVKFLIDSSMSHLVPYLRYCGINTDVISDMMLWHNVVNLAISEERFIILKKLKLTPTVNYPQQNIWEIGIGEPIVVVQKIIEHFRVKVTREDFLTRCMLCNSTALSPIPLNDVRNMYTAYETSKRETACAYSTNDFDPDAFLSDQDSDEELYQSVTVKQCEPITIFTNRGVAIKIDEASDLSSSSNEPIMLCQACGKLYWEGNYPVGNVNEFDKIIT